MKLQITFILMKFMNFLCLIPFQFISFNLVPNLKRFNKIQNQIYFNKILNLSIIIQF